jgi:hypothetical protein
MGEERASDIEWKLSVSGGFENSIDVYRTDTIRDLGL